MLATLVLTSAVGAAPLDPGLLGTWGPSQQPCRGFPQLAVHESGLQLRSAAGRQDVPGADACLACAGGVRYAGPEVWGVFGADGPEGLAKVLVRFNADGKLGVAQLDVEDPALFERFPYRGLHLRRCEPKS